MGGSVRVRVIIQQLWVAHTCIIIHKIHKHASMQTKTCTLTCNDIKIKVKVLCERCEATAAWFMRRRWCDHHICSGICIHLSILSKQHNHALLKVGTCERTERIALLQSRMLLSFNVIWSSPGKPISWHTNFFWLLIYIAILFEHNCIQRISNFHTPFKMCLD